MSSFTSPPEIVSLGSGASPSLSFNNLTIDAGMVAYAHKSSVLMFLEVAARSTGVLPTKLGYRDAANVIQVRWCRAGTGSPLLVIATTAGFQIWDSTGKVSLFTHATPDGFCRGIGGSDESNRIFVGTSTGRLLCATGTSPVALASSFPAHASAVCCVDVLAGVVASSCDSGEVCLWDAGTFKALAAFPGGGYPCTSVKLKDTYVVTAFSTGHLRIFEISSATMVVEVTAHSRCITALDVHPVQDTFVTVGEDAVVSVWTLPERSSGSYHLELIKSQVVEDHLFTGVQFFKSALLACSYDNNVMALIS